MAKVVYLSPTGNPAGFALTNLQPTVGGNGGQVTATILGGGMLQGATFELTGPSTVVGNNVAVQTGGTFATATFDLAGTSAPPGLYNLVATNPDGSTTTLPNTFTVVQGGRAQFWVSVIGRNLAEGGIPTPYIIAYGNSGTVDLNGLMKLWIAFPKYLTSSLGSGLVPSTFFNNDQSETVQSFTFLQIPSGFAGAIPLTITPPTGSKFGHAPFYVRAWTRQTCTPACP